LLDSILTLLLAANTVEAAPGTAVQSVALVAALGLALVHLYAGKLRFLEGTPRSIWLSVAGGVSVAYVFVHLLPEVSEVQETLAEALGSALGFLENHGYLVALVGLVVFYGLERAAKASRKVRGGEAQATSPGVFWLHIGSFTLYNLLVGYLLVRRPEQGLLELVLFSVAMALHFVINDFGLREHHKAAYTRSGRWLLAAAVLLGWLLALFGEASEAALALLLAFLAGGVILNVLKEELPAERESRFWPFAFGAVAYTALLLLL
jgi:zinc transporter ZupT